MHRHGRFLHHVRGGEREREREEAGERERKRRREGKQTRVSESRKQGERGVSRSRSGKKIQEFVHIGSRCKYLGYSGASSGRYVVVVGALSYASGAADAVRASLCTSKGPER